MSAIKVIAGDFEAITYPADAFIQKRILGKLKKVEKLADKQGYAFARALGIGVLGGVIGCLAGFLVAGIVGFVMGFAAGAIVGGLLGGRQSQICFSAELDGGKKFTALTDVETFAEIHAAQGKPVPLEEENENAPDTLTEDAQTWQGTLAWLSILAVFMFVGLIIFALRINP